MGLDRGDASAKRAGWPDPGINAIAERQLTMVSRQQLLALGIAPRTVTDAVARGRLHRVHNGVYSLVPPRVRPRWASEQAALLACGPDAVLSHQTAARLHGLTVHGSAQPVHVTVRGGGTNPRHRGLMTHRSFALTPDEYHRRNGLPVTSVARTVIDLLPTLGARAQEVLVDEALRATSRTKLTAVLALHPGRPGTPALRALLNPGRPGSLTWSQVEERLLLLIRRAGLPAPECNVTLSDGTKPDLLWREARVIIEYDSDEFHSGPRSARRDDARHNELTADGYAVLHITKGHVPERTLAWIARALARSEWSAP